MRARLVVSALVLSLLAACGAGSRTTASAPGPMAFEVTTTTGITVPTRSTVRPPVVCGSPAARLEVTTTVGRVPSRPPSTQPCVVVTTPPTVPPSPPTTLLGSVVELTRADKFERIAVRVGTEIDIYLAADPTSEAGAVNISDNSAVSVISSVWGNNGQSYTRLWADEPGTAFLVGPSFNAPCPPGLGCARGVTFWLDVAVFP